MNLDLEAQILSSFIFNVDSEVYISKLSSSDFKNDDNREIFEVMRDAYIHQQPIDLTLLCDKLPHLDSYIMQISQEFISSVHIEAHVNELRDKTRRISCRDCAEKFRVSLNRGDDIDVVTGELYQNLSALDIGGRIIDMKAVTLNAVNEFEKRATGKSKHILRTGYSYLDKDLLITGDKVIILAARPSCGKTAMMINIAENMARSGRKCFVYSLEMKATRIVDRIIARRSRVNYHDIQDPKNVTSVTMANISDVIKDISALPLYFDEKRNVTINEICAETRRMKAQGKIDILFVDYMQLVGVNKPCKIYERVTMVSRELKCLAGELDIPIIALCQLSRESVKRTDPTPQLIDLRDSGAVEADADGVIMLHRPYSIGKGNDPKDTTLYIRKNRGGELSEIAFDFIGAFQEFREIGSDDDNQTQGGA